MSKTVRVSEDTWNRLDDLRDWKESFDVVIVRLLNMQEILTKVEPIIRGQRAFLEDKIARKKTAKDSESDVIGTDLNGKPLIKRPSP